MVTLKPMIAQGPKAQPYGPTESRPVAYAGPSGKITIIPFPEKAINNGLLFSGKGRATGTLN